MSKEKETTVRVINLEMASNEDEDRLSNLHDSILITILCFLDPKEMIQTCLLSKRWRNLWRFVPCLNFSDKYLRNSRTHQLEGGDLERFRNFVSSFLLSRDNSANLHTFKLRHENSPHSMPWIHYAFSHNPKILDIFFLKVDMDCSFDVTNDLFSCASLEELSLGLCLWEEIVIDNVFLPKLRKMCFKFLSMNQDSLENFLSGCPALESLTFDFCKLNVNCIAFQTVKDLVLYGCEFTSQPPTFSICAPHLEYLEFFEDSKMRVKFKDTSKVKNAFVGGSKTLSFYYKCEYLSSLPGVEDLMIWGWCKERGTHNDLDVHQAVQLVVKSTCRMDRVKIVLED
ncbi:hypothetical protein LUZ60_013654 [Juncus effusus]|nr:hypothetical protein LUZ60_013654 [Juncus effusus]